MPLTGAVIVTTPQDIALLDAKKGIKMFEKVGVPILGIVENMAVHVCANCGHVEHIFGEGGGKRMAAEYGMDYLGALPLDIPIRVQADGGRPTVVADPDGEIAGIYKAVARQVAVKIAEPRPRTSRPSSRASSCRTPERARLSRRARLVARGSRYHVAFDGAAARTQGRSRPPKGSHETEIRRALACCLDRWRRACPALRLRHHFPEPREARGRRAAAHTRQCDARHSHAHRARRRRPDLLQPAGMPPNSEHALQVHERGDCIVISQPDAGPVFAPVSDRKRSSSRLEGDLANIRSDANGAATGFIVAPTCRSTACARWSRAPSCCTARFGGDKLLAPIAMPRRAARRRANRRRGSAQPD